MIFLTEIFAENKKLCTTNQELPVLSILNAVKTIDFVAMILSINLLSQFQECRSKLTENLQVDVKHIYRRFFTLALKNKEIDNANINDSIILIGKFRMINQQSANQF